MDRPLPEYQQGYADQDQREAQASPQAGRSPSAIKAQVISQRQSDEPVRDQVAEERGARISCAAEGAGGHCLYSVEQLEECGHKQ